MKTKEYLIKNFIPIAKEEAKGLSDIIECFESIEHYLSSQPKVQLAEVKKEFETIFLDGHNLDTLESEGFDQQDIDDIRELWTWFSNKLNTLSE